MLCACAVPLWSVGGIATSNGIHPLMTRVRCLRHAFCQNFYQLAHECDTYSNGLWAEAKLPQPSFLVLMVMVVEVEAVVVQRR